MKHRLLDALKALTPQSMVVKIVRYRVAVLTVVLLISLVFAIFLPRLSVTTSVYDLVIEDIPENAEYLDFKALFGNEEIIRLVIKSDNSFDPLVFGKITQLSESSKAVEGVRRVISLPEIKRLVDPTDSWPLDKFERLMADVELFQRNLVSRDRKTSLITMVLDDTAQPARVIAQVEALIDQADTSLSLYQIGMPLISKALGEYTARDFMRLPPITFLIIAVILLVIFKRAAYVILPLACVFIALTWTFGLMAISAIPLSMLTMIVPVFLIAVGTAYCLHIIAAHRTALTQASTGLDAVLQTYDATAFPTILAIGTTVLSLCSLFASRITAINEFALFAAVGMVSFLTVLLTLLPAALSFLKPGRSAPPAEKRTSAVQRFIDMIIAVHMRHQRKALVVIGVIAAICAVGLLQLKVETNPVDYFKADAAVKKHFHDIYQHLSGSFPVHLTMAGAEEDYFQNPQHISAIAEVQQYLDQQPGVDKTVSFADYLKLVNYASNGFKRENYRLPQEAWEMRMLLNSFRSLLGRDILAAFMSADFTQTNILMLTHISSSRDFLKLRKTVLHHLSRNFSQDLQWRMTGFGMVISASSKLLTVGQIKSLSLTLACIVIIMFVLFMSFKVGLIAAGTNLFPIVVNFGIMGWLGIELSMATSLIASVAIGLAVDDTIHYLVRFNREFRIDLNEQRALKATLAHIGRPIVFTTLTISIGFCVLLFSSFKPTAIFGGMMIITMAAALVGDLVLLPALMQRVELVTLWDLVRIKMGRDPELEIPLFKGFTRAELHSVMMAGTLVSVDAGDALFRKGEISQTMYVVISGAFDVLDYHSLTPTALDDIQKRVSSCHAGDIIGEMGLLRQVPRSASVVAVQDSELLLINWRVIQRLQWLYPPTAVKFFKNLSETLSNRVEHLTQCLSNESCIDDLTGICNRKGFCQVLETELRRAARYDEPLGLCLLDVTFNGDASGQGGKSHGEMLSRLADGWRRQIRNCDTLSRIAAGRFVLLFPKIPPHYAGQVAQRLQAVADAVMADVEPSDFSLSQAVFDFPKDTPPDGEQALVEAMRRMGVSDFTEDDTCVDQQL